MGELHRHVQCFFGAPTLHHLAATNAARWQAPCCLYALLLGRRLAGAGVDVSVFDINEQFADVPGFHRLDIHRPKWLGRSFNVIVCEPPCFSILAARLFAAIRILGRNDFTQTLMVSYLSRRSAAILGTLAPFGLAPTGYHPGYQTVQSPARNDVAFFAGIGEDAAQTLTAPRCCVDRRCR